MPAGTPRGGIEWRILKSILLIGALPLIVAIVGLLIAARGQTSAVKENLSIAADTTSYGLRNAASIRLEALDRLARNPRIVGALIPSGPDGKPSILSSSQAKFDVRDFLGRRTDIDYPESSMSVYALYDAKGDFVDGTDVINDGDRPSHPAWVWSVQTPRFMDLEFVPDQDRYLAQAVAPVFSPTKSERIGFVAETFDITPLLMYGLGYDPRRDSTPPVGDHYRLVSPNETGEVVAWRLEPTANAESPKFVRESLEADFGTYMLDPARGASGTAVVSRMLADAPALATFIAYNRIFDDYPLFVLVSRPASMVYAPIWFWSILAIAACALSIGFFYLNAYRNVHNNIVRPVLLLNEGAQIIERGDLELKLKIGTGDEIEELAMSFNKMALALKRNIRQLEESEEKYRGLVDSMRDGIFQADLDGVIGFVNPAAAEILGFESQDDAIGTNIRTLFREVDEVASFFSELKEKGFVERSRIWMQRSDERATCVELSGNLLHDEDRKPNGIEGIFRDVTKNIRLERDARDRAERLSVISQIANVINSSLEAGRLYESLVVEVKKLIDFDYAELALLDDEGDRFEAQALWPEHSAPAREYTVSHDDSVSARVLKTGECLIMADLNASGSPVNGHFAPGLRSCVSVPLFATGRIIGTLNLGAQRIDAFTQHDVDVLQQMAPHIAVAIRNAQLLENLQQSLEEVTLAREKLHEANEELKTLDEMKTNLLSNVSHELRTPLVSVMGYTDMIINGKAGPVNAEQKEYLGISLRNIEKLVTLIENLLDFSRLHRGTETIVFDEFDLRDCAKASMQVIQPVADSRGIKLELKAPAEPVLVEGDKSKLGQVFTNLLSNAVKFNKADGSIVVEFTIKDDCVHAAVHDTGIGIPQEALDKVFTRFYQYDSSSTRKYGGTGIGLSISQDIARLHGTRITVSSEVGKGSTFRFVLPLAGVRRADMRDTGGEGEAPGTRLLVELVTLDRALSAQVRTLLQSEGMDVIHALDAQHGINLAQRHSPDCLLVDCATEDDAASSPLLDALLADKSAGDIPIIMMTGDEELYARYRSLVASRVKRSFRKSSLLSGIQYAIGQSLSTGEPLGHKVLCVDDDPEVLRFIERCLEAEGFDVVTCVSGEQALRLALTREFGVVLMDIAMPGMDGWEACRRLKRDHTLTGIKVFMVTAKPVDSTSSRYRDYGADGYLLKPFHAEDLLELVQSVATPRMVREV
ncbi:MAG: response regulator [Candidatus Hydrogenedentes bacterium]|nr:response regulator [Candidatus Hydrogenedentota bacterium]